MKKSPSSPLPAPLASQVQEEILNITLHGFGLLLSLIGFGTMVGVAVQSHSLTKLFAASTYSATLIVMYIGSLLFHTSLAVDIPWKKALEVVDHSAIYLLIAGSYTPFLMVSLQGTKSWILLALIWLIAVIGVLYKVFFFYKSDALSTLAYVAMGWMCLFFIKDLYYSIGWQGLSLLGAGGIFYTVGSLFYLFDHKFKYAHAIWHICVMVGSLLHYLSVFFFVILPGSGTIH
jgi:hemolysin III